MRDRVGQSVSEVFQALGELTRAIGRLISVFTDGHHHFHLKEAHFMFIVKDTQPDVRFSADFEVRDAEGQLVTDPAVLATVTTEVVSDNPDAVAVTPDADDPRKGSAHFGAPGLANVNCTVKLADGTLVGSFGAQFTVTVGDPAAIAGGAISFEGLAESPTP